MKEELNKLIEFKNQSFNCEKELCIKYYWWEMETYDCIELLREEPLRLSQIEKAIIPSTSTRINQSAKRIGKRMELITHTI
ncbi:hypothetical protein WKW43_14205 (plasmid) [Staphylococcus pseudoxylosus]|uniref:hypothetical protein n=1 Tax=Staphylococcus pseudoxylosus TaxID=2282419 RepID=UPI003D805886